MARTKASVGAKVASGKSSKARCSVAAPPTSYVASGSGERSSKSSSGGGNSVCPRETPKWQKPITNFFISKETNENTREPDDPDEETATSSKAKPKRNIIQSDSEDEEEQPKNKELDESIILEPLTGENSHKLDEYYPKNGVKGKGVGKKTKGKENLGSNTKNGDTTRKKRDLDDIVEEQASKKVKVC